MGCDRCDPFFKSEASVEEPAALNREAVACKKSHAFREKSHGLPAAVPAR
jgi:hypothetical protein